MNLSASALFIALITGLLGAWLFLWMSERQHTDYRVQESRVACDKARFDTEFSGNFGKPSKAALERERVACGDAASQNAMRAESEEKARREGQQLKQSIENALETDEVKAKKQEAEAKAKAQAAASSVAETTNATMQEFHR